MPRRAYHVRILCRKLPHQKPFGFPDDPGKAQAAPDHLLQEPLIRIRRILHHIPGLP